MPISISSQAYIFLYSIVGGMVIAFIYDIFRVKRRTVKTASIFIYIEDLLYWIIVAVVMFGTLYYTNDGEIRGYIFLGSILGVILYAVLLSNIIISVFLAIIKLITIVLTTIWKVITFPFVILIRILSYPARFLMKLCKKVFRKCRRMTKNWFYAASMWGKRIRNKIKRI